MTCVFQTLNICPWLILAECYKASTEQNSDYLIIRPVARKVNSPWGEAEWAIEWPKKLDRKGSNKVEEIFIWEWREKRAGEVRYSRTITNSLLVA